VGEAREQQIPFGNDRQNGKGNCNNNGKDNGRL